MAFFRELMLVMILPIDSTVEDSFLSPDRTGVVSGVTGPVNQRPTQEGNEKPLSKLRPIAVHILSELM